MLMHTRPFLHSGAQNVKCAGKAHFTACGGKKKTLAFLGLNCLAGADNRSLPFKDQQGEEGVRSTQRALRSGEQIHGKAAALPQVTAKVEVLGAG